MRKNSLYLFSFMAAGLLATAIISSCQKDAAPAKAAPTPTTPASLSFTEDFDDVSGLTAKGWVLKNNSSPVGQQGWRQGRYETLNSPSKKFQGNIVGFPAYNSTNSPNDFISCDITCVNTQGNISSWLISPPMTIKNGDKLTFYTRTQDDSQFSIFTKDRMQVRGNFTDGSANVGTSATSVGSFTNLLLDINSSYIENDNGGYPYLAWVKQTITFSGLSGTVTNARIAFRYFGTDAGLQGPNYPSVVGIDNIVFTSN